jgi:hypothetical protein
VLVLFVGVAAALRYAADQGWFTLPLWARFVGIAAAALAALVFALTQRAQRPAFSLSLQGGAIGVLLLCSFAAFRLDVLAAGPALACVVVLVALGAALAVWQNAAALALLGFLGGYLGPIRSPYSPTTLRSMPPCSRWPGGATGTPSIWSASASPSASAACGRCANTRRRITPAASSSCSCSGVSISASRCWAHCAVALLPAMACRPR